MPVTLIARLFNFNSTITFVTACLAIIPLAAVIGNATEQLSNYASPKISGLLNATMSNIPELSIGLFSVKAGLYNLVLASMAGSIIGNILLVLGVSIFAGGIKYKYQYFSKANARSNFLLLCFAAASIIIPFTFKHATAGHPNQSGAIACMGFGLCILMVSLYIMGLIFSLITHKNIFTQHDEKDTAAEDESSLEAGADSSSDKIEAGVNTAFVIRRCILTLITAAIFVSLCSEILVSTVEQVIKSTGMTELFIGIILLPILGNVSENASAVIMAVKNKVDVSVEIAIGSSMQISLFVAPVLVLCSYLTGSPMQYIYNTFEIVAIIIGIVMSLYIFQDGKTSWLEGVLLIATYLAFALAFFFL